MFHLNILENMRICQPRLLRRNQTKVLRQIPLIQLEQRNILDLGFLNDYEILEGFRNE